MRAARLAMMVLCCVPAAWLTACSNRTSIEATPGVTIEALRFPHERHATISCLDCHGASVQSMPVTRPAHATCDAAECHQAAFRGPAGELCGLCHEGVSNQEGGSSPLMPFPPAMGPRAKPSRFSHAQHLDAASMEERLGFHISCTDCHELSQSLDGPSLRSPGHADCARCHAPEAAPEDTPAMTDCVGCHSDTSKDLPRQRDFITGDLHFNHREHRSDRRGALISCATCHDRTVAATALEVGMHAAPTMQVCVACHDDSERVPLEKRMRRCETCHSTRSAGLRALAPRSHMPATERPANHTQAFRRDHGDDARADANACASCHTVLSGNSRDTCDECHQIMRPQDHVITWREYDHGPDAATEAERCTTCHQVDFCASCHRNRPRSHFPTMEFRSGGHGTQAIFNMRACVTCHTPSRDCSGSGCHRADGL